MFVDTKHLKPVRCCGTGYGLAQPNRLHIAFDSNLSNEKQKMQQKTDATNLLNFGKLR